MTTEQLKARMGITAEQIEKFAKAVREFDIEQLVNTGVSRILAVASLEAMQSTLSELIDEYSQLKQGGNK